MKIGISKIKFLSIDAAAAAAAAAAVITCY